MSIRIVVTLCIFPLFMGCASNGNAVRPSYRGETKVSSRTPSQKEQDKVHKSNKTEQSNPKNNSTPKLNNIEKISHKYIGVRYKYGGTTSKGFDCSGYVWRVYQDLGVDFSRASSKAYFQRGKKISRGKAEKGDLVFFKEKGRINHVGIYLGGDRFVHASSSRGVIESSLTNSYWKPRIAGFRRYF